MTRYYPCHEQDVWVGLTSGQYDYAVEHGIEMRQFSMRQNHKNHKGYDPDDEKAYRIQILGALAELAARKMLGKPMILPAQTYGEADILPDWQVRLIGADRYGLRCYPSDPETRNLLGVVIPPGQEHGPYRSPGWYPVKLARQRPAWSMAPNNRPPMICVPQDSLLDLRPLLRLRTRP